ncbi:hypothetical protein HYALB_00006411 [Hymenoscyphus albidus]|uniref:Uncharacterized protein n=1 Tax=Hymenoscyphus albidus TaxID=595503 RepID=A0A9N9LLF8_9HELO|nr:hypothetical protein HYALB_00006411 [Hymenoscyphus albidus]
MNTYDWSNEVVNASWWARCQIEHWAEWEFWPSNKSNFVCDTKNNVYQWGFTYEWFVVVVGANSIWLFGMYVLWMECQFNSELCKKKRHLGIWRAIADLSEAMREDLGSDVCAYSNKEIARVLKKRPPIKYYVEDDYKSEAAHIGLSSRPSGQVLLRWDRIYAGKKEKEH